jgi:predicted Zn-ribbon and HTH transcriptional regulator
MDKEILKELVDKGLSIYKISEEMSLGYSTIRYWLRKFGLNTQHAVCCTEIGTENGRKCKQCNNSLTFKQRMYCSKKCKAQYHYNNNTNENPNTNERQLIRSTERKLKLIEMSGGRCMKCGYNKNYAALSFHHRIPNNKTFNLDSRKLSNTRWESIIKEWEKCDLLCMNCHIEEHYPDKII